MVLQCRCVGAHTKAGWPTIDLVDQLAELLGRHAVLHRVGNANFDATRFIVTAADNDLEAPKSRLV